MRGGGVTALSLVGVREDSPWILCRGECILSHYESRFIRYPRLDTQTLKLLLLMSMVLVSGMLLTLIVTSPCHKMCNLADL